MHPLLPVKRFRQHHYLTGRSNLMVYAHRDGYVEVEIMPNQYDILVLPNGYQVKVFDNNSFREYNPKWDTMSFGLHHPI